MKNPHTMKLIKLFHSRYREEFSRVIKLPQITKRLDKFRDLMKNLTRWTGQNINSFDDMACLYSTLRAEKASDLPLPDWTNGIFPDGLLLDAAIFTWEIVSYNTKLKRLNGGL